MAISVMSSQIILNCIEQETLNGAGGMNGAEYRLNQVLKRIERGEDGMAPLAEFDLRFGVADDPARVHRAGRYFRGEGDQIVHADADSGRRLRGAKAPRPELGPDYRSQAMVWSPGRLTKNPRELP
jgi:hypothetical protein